MNNNDGAHEAGEPLYVENVTKVGERIRESFAILELYELS